MAINPHLRLGINKKIKLKSRPERDIQYYLEGIRDGNRFILSESITLLESNTPEKRELGLKILNEIGNLNENTLRIGITGTPGVGKSTFIEALGKYFIGQGHKVAVLVIDPSSHIYKGSILGDKTRMQDLSTMPEAYIRPTASGAILGGTAIYTKETITLCEAAGFDTVFIETVGVGQSEIEVGFMTDVNVLMLQPGAGDEIQGIKRGIMENADIFVINKADGALLPLAKQSRLFYRNAIQLFHHEVEGWKCPVVLASSTENTGLKEIYLNIQQYKEKLIELDLFKKNRLNQDIRWFYQKTKEMIESIVFKNPQINATYKELIANIESKTLTTPSALATMESKLKSLLP